MSKKTFLKAIAILPILFLGCIDPVEPEFEYKEGLVFIEGFASTAPGGSYVIINKSANQFGVNTTVVEKGAIVSFKNTDTGESIDLIENEEAYLPPSDFVVAVNERWELAITLIDGTQYSSSPEVVLDPVPFSDVTTTFTQELDFNDSSGKFRPGHSIAVTFDDPANAENFYYWTFRSFENVVVCKQCQSTVFRDGQCIDTPASTPDYYDYLCDVDCWRIRFPESINIFNDEFTNGTRTTNLEVAKVPLYTKENIVIELRQLSLTPAAYQYYKVLKDIVDNTSGLNAPPPAALVGNMVNPNDSEDFVFGRFTAAATTTKSIFLKRRDVRADAIEFSEPLVLEPTLNSPHPPPATTFAPCTENRFRTAIQPEGWME